MPKPKYAAQRPLANIITDNQRRWPEDKSPYAFDPDPYYYCGGTSNCGGRRSFAIAAVEQDHLPLDTNRVCYSVLAYPTRTKTGSRMKFIIKRFVKDLNGTVVSQDVIHEEEVINEG